MRLPCHSHQSLLIDCSANLLDHFFDLIFRSIQILNRICNQILCVFASIVIWLLKTVLVPCLGLEKLLGVVQLVNCKSMHHGKTLDMLFGKLLNFLDHSRYNQTFIIQKLQITWKFHELIGFQLNVVWLGKKFFFTLTIGFLSFLQDVVRVIDSRLSQFWDESCHEDGHVGDHHRALAVLLDHGGWWRRWRLDRPIFEIFFCLEKGLLSLVPLLLDLCQL